MTPASSALPASQPLAAGFVDGFGVRSRSGDPGGEAVDVLRLRQELASGPGFDFALRERVNRLANFRHAYYGRVRRVDRPDSRTLDVVSDAAEGARLSRILEVAHHFDLDLDVNAALCLLRQIVPAVAMLHQNARDVSHGALAPERIVVTPGARVVLVEYVLGAAIESLGYSRDRLWKDLRVAVPAGAGPARINHRADVMQIGVVALALVLGRPIADDDVRDLQGLLASATENSVMGGRQPISDSLRRWLARALQLDTRGAFESALEAQLALDDVLSGDAGYIAAPVALESFLARYEEFAPRMPEVEAAARPVPAAVPTAVPTAVAGVPGPVEGEREPDDDEDSASQAAAAIVPPRRQKLGVAKVSANLPAVPSFRAVASPAAPSKAAQPPAPIDPVAVEPPATEGDAARAPEPVRAAVPDAPAATTSTSAITPTEPGETREEAFDEDHLRAQFLAASATADAPAGGIGRRWRIAAVLLLLIAAAEGGFIWWRFASSPSGLLGTDGTLKVESKPLGAQVKIDGEPKGVTPLSLSLRGGAHVMEIDAGGEPRVIPLTISAGETLAQYVELVGVATNGRLSIQSTPAGATVLLDGQPRGQTPLELPDVGAGDHELVLDLNGQRTRQTVSVAAGVTTTVDLPMTPAVETAGMFPAPVPTTGVLLVQAPFEMQVIEAGAVVGLSGARLTMAPGPHTVEIVSQTLGFKTTATVEIVAGKTARVPVALPKGTAHLNATPWAEVWVDGKKVGETPIGNLALTVGPHEIVFSHPELGEQAHAATVRVGEPLRLSVDLTRR